MPDTFEYDELVALATQHADALCELLPGEWRRVEDMHSQATIADGRRELQLHAFEQNGKARLCLQARLPDGWSGLEGIAPPQITVAADRASEAVASEVTRRLLPVHNRLEAEVRTAVDAQAHRQAACSAVVNHFVRHVPGGRPDLHHPGSAASSSGPDLFGARLRVVHDAQSADLHLRNTPVALYRSLVALIGSHFHHAEQPETAGQQALDQLADAITAVAAQRRNTRLDRLLRETALNVLLLGRICSTLLDDQADQARLEHLTDQLVHELRQRSRHQSDGGTTADRPQTT